MTDDDYVDVIRELDSAVTEVDGAGFTETPYAKAPPLASDLGLADGAVWIKDETGNVSGSHKARHLMGVAIYLAIAERTGLVAEEDATRRLSIASCGNAALAAAVVARAAGRQLNVFVPTWAEPSVVTRLEDLGADIVVCDRRAVDPPGDPCILRFRADIDGEAVPFSCQGPENGLTIEGGMTLGWEIAVQHAVSGSPPIDRFMVQVGGGALASACVQAFRWARNLGAMKRLPTIHAVQTEAGHPLERAWHRIVDSATDRLVETGVEPPTDDTDRGMAEWLQSHHNASPVREEFDHAARRRSDYMWPVEVPSHSVASGILDDETYDWMEIVRGMIETGGWPVIVDESTLVRAWEIGDSATTIPADATGTAGLAGAYALRETGDLEEGEQMAILFTGVRR
jgi:threonine synthase